jgi:hypothetical protein
MCYRSRQVSVLGPRRLGQDNAGHGLFGCEWHGALLTAETDGVATAIRHTNPAARVKPKIRSLSMITSQMPTLDGIRRAEPVDRAERRRGMRAQIPPVTA